MLNIFKKTFKYAALFIMAFGLGYYSFINDLGYGVEVHIFHCFGPTMGLTGLA